MNNNAGDILHRYNYAKVLRENRAIWREGTKAEGFERALGRYLDALRNYANNNELLAEIGFMLSCYREPQLPAESLAAHIVRLLGPYSLTEHFYQNSKFTREVSICIMLEASSLMPFDDWEIANVKKVVLQATGHDITNVEEELVATKVAELLFAPGWSELVFSDWTMYTSSAQKIQQLLVAPLRNSCSQQQILVEIPNDMTGSYDE